MALGVLIGLSGLAPSRAEMAPAAVRTSSVERPQRLSDLFGPGASTIGRSVVVGGLGSSVGAGATLGNGERDAPVAYFAAALIARTPSADLGKWAVVNGSVNGSTIHDGLTRDWDALSRSHPDVVVLAYGMNDGAPAQFEMGETFGGAMKDLAELVVLVRASGAVPVILTSPSAHTTRTGWAIPPGPAIAQEAPVNTDEPVRTVLVPGVGPAAESTRHAAVDEGMRRVGLALDVDVIDVEPFWLKAVAARGEDALFDPLEFVHPNLLGHRLSYHAAIDTDLPRLLTAR